MEEMVQSFLRVEITDQDFYEGIIDFIDNENIRCGEYECNEFVIKKMDLLNFIVYVEYEVDNKREIHGTFSMSKITLLKTIHEYAKRQGFRMSGYRRFT